MRKILVLAFFALGACGPYTPYMTAVGLGTLVAMDKPVTDHAVSHSLGEDCSIVRWSKGGGTIVRQKKRPPHHNSFIAIAHSGKMSVTTNQTKTPLNKHESITLQNKNLQNSNYYFISFNALTHTCSANLGVICHSCAVSANRAKKTATLP